MWIILLLVFTSNLVLCTLLVYFDFIQNHTVISAAPTAECTMFLEYN